MTARAAPPAAGRRCPRHTDGEEAEPGLKDRLELTRYAIRVGLIEP
ncbi:hypothetical protein ACFSUJ_16255 [Streptomyces lusitanus]|uniref:Uncharacterized protein n=1 Tax=Streptomyces lusitanus TaxID=68232 RepID=A0ABU3K056_9ACTN|nr:hypothetical protein [Streptomyces lusitanus]